VLYFYHLKMSLFMPLEMLNLRCIFLMFPMENKVLGQVVVLDVNVHE